MSFDTTAAVRWLVIFSRASRTCGTCSSVYSVTTWGGASVCMCVHVRACVCIQGGVCLCVQGVCVYVHMCVYIEECVCACVYKRVCVRESA